MTEITKTKSYCRPPGCRCPIIEVVSESKTKEVVAVHIRESAAEGVSLVLDFCSAAFNTKEAIAEKLETFINSLKTNKDTLATDIADLVKESEESNAE
jgi:hypothetical protein